MKHLDQNLAGRTHLLNISADWISIQQRYTIIYLTNQLSIK